MVSRGRSSDRARGGAHNWPSPIVPEFPSRGNFGDDGHVAIGNESGFPKFPRKKYLGGDSVSGKAVHVWHFFSKKSVSQNDLPDLDSLVQIKNRDTNWVRTVARRPHACASTVFGDSAEDFRELDSNSWYPVLISFMCFFALHVHWCA